MKNEQKESYTEVLTILKYMETKYTEKIPKKLIDFFEKNSEKDYNFDIDLDISLKEQKLKTKTLSLLAMLNLNYWCNEEERKELINRYSENQRRYQEELLKKYNQDSIFKKHIQKDKIIEEKYIEDEVVLVEYKESIFKRFIQKIKNIFSIV